MKQLLYLFITLFSISFAQAQQHTCTANSLNVRIAPKADAKAVGALTKGQVVEVTEINGSWATIEFAGRKAYVAAKFLDKGTGETSTQKKEKTSTTGIADLQKIAADKWQYILGALVGVIALFMGFKLMRRQPKKAKSEAVNDSTSSTKPVNKVVMANTSASTQGGAVNKKQTEAEDDWKEVDF